MHIFPTDKALFKCRFLVIDTCWRKDPGPIYNDLEQILTYMFYSVKGVYRVLQK